MYPHTCSTVCCDLDGVPSHLHHAQLEILRCTDTAAAKWELLEPSGLRISFEKLARSEFLVPVPITDAFGNSLTITYEAYGGVYFQHPLPKKVTDGLNRSLEFSYVFKTSKSPCGRYYSKAAFYPNIPTIPTRRRPVVQGQLLRPADRAYLKTHESGAGRLTTYTVELTAAGPALGTIKAIQAPTGGITTFEYELRRVFYKPDAIEYLYVVTKIKRGGGDGPIHT